MWRLVFLPILLSCTTLSFADSRSVCPKHIEIPVYSPIARAAHVSGEVVVRVTMDANGRVTRAEALSGPDVLRPTSLDNIRRWTFAAPPHADFTQTLTYVYKFDEEMASESATIVTFDLPDRVTLVTPVVSIQP